MIQNACSDILIEPDWGLNMEIVDVLNSEPHLCEASAEILIRMIAHKNPERGLLALTLAETIVKNVPAFHSSANNQRFLDNLVAEFERTKNPNKSFFARLSNTDEHWRVNLQKQEKILLLIESWGRAFSMSKSFPNFQKVYQDLKFKGVRFPQPLKDEMAPVFTPPADKQAPSISSSSANTSAEPCKDSLLSNIQENALLLTDLLNSSDPEQDLQKDEVIQQLRKVLIKSQGTVLKRVASSNSEEDMAHSLGVNDDIVGALQLYEGLLNGTMERKSKQREETKEQKRKISSSRALQIEDEKQPDDEHKTDNIADILDLGVQSNVMLPRKLPSARKSSAKEIESVELPASDVIVPRLPPPPSSGRLSTSNVSVSNITSTKAFNVNLDASKDESVENIKTEEDLDEFLSIAMRDSSISAESAKEIEKKNPADDIFDKLFG